MPSDPSEMVAAARALAAFPEIDAFPRTGALPAAFFAALDRLRAAYDAWIERELARGPRTSCVAGCSRCCRQPVRGVYTFEVIDLYRALWADPAHLQDVLQRALDRTLEFSAELRRHGGPSPEATDRAHLALAAKAAPCPFLEGDRCTVYARRPASCRMYHSRGDPRLCTSPAGATFEVVWPAEVVAILLDVQRRLGAGTGLLSADLVTFAQARDFQPLPGPG